MQEKIIETKTCKHCSSSFHITDWDLNFYEKVSPTFAWKKYLITSPTLCPDCRLQRRLSWCNERKLYHRKSDFSCNQMLSIYSPDKELKVFEYNEWWSDKWNALDYWMSFNFEKNFSEQFEELLKKVPLINLLWNNNENSDYVNLTVDSKNCYLVTESSNNENSYYSYWIQKCENVCDVSFSHECTKCYEIQDSYYCYNLFYSKNCIKTSSSWFMENSEWCNFCFGCVNLVNKNYHIFNKKVTKEEFESFMKEFYKNLEENIKKYSKEFEEFSLKFPKKYTNVRETENSSWDYMKNTKNCNYCFHAYDAQDCKYSEHVWRNAKDVMDGNVVWRDSNKIYEALNTNMNSYECLFCAVCWYSHNLYYCFHCFSCSNCFWCVWLRDKEYCIFNKEYSREEYEKLVPKIIEHMKNTWEYWEFFSQSISPFWYNETVAQEYFLLEKDEILKLWFKWSDYEKQNWYNWEFYEPLKISNYNENISWSEIANKNKEILLKWILKCEKTWKPYKIIKSELEFYIKNYLEIPKVHPDVRHINRINARNPRKLFNRNCDRCWIQIKTTYSPDRKEIVYCWSCYDKEVY